MIAKKLISLLTASAMCTAWIPVISAVDLKGIKANIGLASADFSIQSWNVGTVNEGENLLTCRLPKNEQGKGTSLKGIGLLVVDLEDCYYDIGEVKVSEILVDGKPISFNESSIVYGADDGADNDTFRVELFNSLGETAGAPPFDPSAVTVNESVSVRFTVSKDGGDNSLRKVNGNVVVSKDEDSTIAVTGYSMTMTLSEKDKNYDPKNVQTIKCNVSGDKFSAELKKGIYDVTLSKNGYVTHQLKDVRIGKRNPTAFTDLELRIYGDVNGDNMVNAADITSIISILKGDTPTDDYHKKMADCSEDNRVDAADITSVVSIIKGEKTYK